MPNKNQLKPAISYTLTDLVEYAPAAIVSRTIQKSHAGSITLFAFAAGQELSEHTAPYDAWVQVLDGDGTFIIGNETVKSGIGKILFMPADVPHAVIATNNFKMILTMVRE